MSDNENDFVLTDIGSNERGVIRVHDGERVREIGAGERAEFVAQSLQNPDHNPADPRSEPTVTKWRRLP
jgi:hypothetical protein